MQFSQVLVTIMALTTAAIAAPVEVEVRAPKLPPGSPCPYISASAYQYCCFDTLEGPYEPLCGSHVKHGDCCPP